jgi:hypothetical protein
MDAGGGASSENRRRSEELNAMANKRHEQDAATTGPTKGQFIAPPEADERDERVSFGHLARSGQWPRK